MVDLFLELFQYFWFSQFMLVSSYVESHCSNLGSKVPNLPHSFWCYYISVVYKLYLIGYHIFYLLDSANIYG